jgi:hypothetical protein
VAVRDRSKSECLGFDADRSCARDYVLRRLLGENEVAFERLEKRDPELTRVQLFDRIRWSFIRLSAR